MWKEKAGIYLPMGIGSAEKGEFLYSRAIRPGQGQDKDSGFALEYDPSI